MNNTLTRFISPGIAVVALVFGLITIVSGGKVLFGGEAARDDGLADG